MPKQVEISDEVRDVLERSRTEGPVLILPDGQLDRALYVDVDRVLKALGGKWERRLGGHVFPRAFDGLLAEALESGRAVDQKRTLEQFWTPPGVVAQMCDLAGDFECEDVLEPSCGDGALLREIIERGGFPTAVEIDPETANRLTADLEGRVPVMVENFMDWTPVPPITPEAFDLVLMNPPFGRGQDMAHVRRALGFLRPQGRLVSVMSPHWTFAGEKAALEFRDALRRHDHTWLKLPPGTFKREGTGVETGLLSIWKGNRT